MKLVQRIIKLIVTLSHKQDNTYGIPAHWVFHECGVWLGGEVLDKLPVPGRPTIWMIVGQEPFALAVGLFGHFYFSLFFLSFLPLFGRRSDID